MTATRTPHNLQYPTRYRHDPLDQLASLPTVRPDQSQARKLVQKFVYDQLFSISVLNIGRMNHHRQHQPHRIHDDMPLASHHFLTSIIATRPPFSVILTDWLSMMAALGVGLLPSASRTLGRRVSWTLSHVPSSVHPRTCNGSGGVCDTSLTSPPIPSCMLRVTAGQAPVSGYGTCLRPNDGAAVMASASGHTDQSDTSSVGAEIVRG